MVQFFLWCLERHRSFKISYIINLLFNTKINTFYVDLLYILLMFPKNEGWFIKSCIDIMKMKPSFDIFY